jgi:acetyl esterase/lipase
LHQRSFLKVAGIKSKTFSALFSTEFTQAALYQTSFKTIILSEIDGDSPSQIKKPKLQPLGTPQMNRPLSRIIFPSLCLFMLIFSNIATAADEPVITLWPDGTPGAVGKEAVDIPTLTVFKPTGKNSGVAVVVCPGGGYGGLAAHENQPIAEWLASRGITAFVLKYRLGPRYRHPAMINDANRAIRTVRAGAAEFGVNPSKIGILGFSAGGHLASTAGTHYDAGNPKANDKIEQASSRPDFMVLCYPVIAMATEYGHGGSKKNLLGDNPPEELVKSLSNETQVTKDTPPTFIVQTHEDKPVPAENAILFILALRKAGVPCELHMFEKGRHGLGLGMGDPAFSRWPELCEIWLKQRGILEK